MIIRRSSQKSNAPDMLSRAQKLMKLGFKVLLLQPAEHGVMRSGKAPITLHGVKDATNDFATFKRLMPASGDFNIGIATGSASNVIVLDVDPRNGGLREFVDLTKRLGPLPRTLTSETGGGGRHYYFRLPAGWGKKKVLAPGVDLLADGSYAVAPPSRHSSGKRYRWLDGRGPENPKIALLPEPWLQFIEADNRARNEPVARDGDEIREGSRNVELTRIAGQLRRSGLSEVEMLAALRGVNQARCRPPVGDEEVTQIARNIAQYAVGVEPRDEGQKVAQALLDAEFGGGPSHSSPHFSPYAENRNEINMLMVISGISITY